jgi:hypothetical protein
MPVPVSSSAPTGYVGASSSQRPGSSNPRFILCVDVSSANTDRSSSEISMRILNGAMTSSTGTMQGPPSEHERSYVFACGRWRGLSPSWSCGVASTASSLRASRERTYVTPAPNLLGLQRPAHGSDQPPARSGGRRNRPRSRSSACAARNRTCSPSTGAVSPIGTSPTGRRHARRSGRRWSATSARPARRTTRTPSRSRG